MHVSAQIGLKVHCPKHGAIRSRQAVTENQVIVPQIVEAARWPIRLPIQDDPEAFAGPKSCEVRGPAPGRTQRPHAGFLTQADLHTVLRKGQIEDSGIVAFLSSPCRRRMQKTAIAIGFALDDSAFDEIGLPRPQCG